MILPWGEVKSVALMPKFYLSQFSPSSEIIIPSTVVGNGFPFKWLLLSYCSVSPGYPLAPKTPLFTLSAYCYIWCLLLLLENRLLTKWFLAVTPLVVSWRSESKFTAAILCLNITIPTFGKSTVKSSPFLTLSDMFLITLSIAFLVKSLDLFEATPISVKLTLTWGMIPLAHLMS